MDRELNSWYWVTHPHEGDVWYPVFVDNEGGYVMAGQVEDKKMMDQLTWQKAVMPEQEANT
ncbi:MAG: hypothetical protein JKX72_02515 [Robiginitomaculum sp.]|nr:hypothetical protein [Robiginitomaculum sp.]